MKGDRRFANFQPSEASAKTNEMVFGAIDGTLDGDRETVCDLLKVSIKEELDSSDEASEENVDASERSESSICGLTPWKVEVGEAVNGASETGCDESTQLHGSQSVDEAMQRSRASDLQEAFASYAERAVVQKTRGVSPNELITETTNTLFNTADRNFNEQCQSAYDRAFVRVKEEPGGFEDAEECVLSDTKCDWSAYRIVPSKHGFDEDSGALDFTNDGFTERNVDQIKSEVLSVTQSPIPQDMFSEDAEKAANSASDPSSIDGTFNCQNESEDASDNDTGSDTSDASTQATGIPKECNVVFHRINSWDVEGHRIVPKCLHCNLTYATLQSLMLHDLMHSGETEFACADCDETIASTYNLKVYKMLRPGGDKPYKCIQCDKRFAYFYCLRNHMVKHDQELLFACSRCDKTFHFTSWLLAHKRIRAAEGHFTCSYCGKGFARLSSLMFHEHVHGVDRPFMCSQCSKTFTSMSGLASHTRVHTGDLFACSQCEKKFIHKKDLREHERIHTGEKPFACTCCGRRFFRNRELTKHQIVHMEEKPFACSQCSKRFTRYSYLKDHERIHTGAELFVCSQCNKRFACYSSLKNHERNHVGQKPFACNHCSRRFIHDSDLMAHQTVHTGEKPFSCSQCDKSFTRHSSLKDHERTHTGEKRFACSQCDKRFTRHSSLKQHERIHTGRKPFACTHCGKTFLRNGDLTKHLVVHTGDKSVPRSAAQGSLLTAT